MEKKKRDYNFVSVRWNQADESFKIIVVRNGLEITKIIDADIIANLVLQELKKGD